MRQVSLCARAVTAWHASWLAALGLRSEADSEVWRALDALPFIYFGAITLRPGTPVEAVLGAPGSICDSWQMLDLGLRGYTIFRQEPWFYRPAGSLPDETPAELEVVRVTTASEVEEFEAVSVRGFGTEEDTIEPGTFHPPAILEDTAMAMFTVGSTASPSPPPWATGPTKRSASSGSRPSPPRAGAGTERR